MGIEAVKYNAKVFWLQEATAEFWFTVYLRVLKNKANLAEWEVDFAKKIEEDITHGWIIGTLLCFDEYLIDQSRLDKFILRIEEVNEYIYNLCKQKGNEESIAIDEFDWRMQLDILIPEMEMFYKFFLHPEEVPNGTYYKYTIGKWVQDC